MFLVVVLYALLALTFTLGKAAVAYANPVFLVAFRMIVAGVLLLGFYGLTKRLKVSVTGQDFFNFAQVILFHIYLSFVPEFWALQFISSVKVNIMYATTPFITVLLSYFLYNERIKKAQLVGICVAFVGLLPLMARGEGFALRDLLSISLPEGVLFLSIASAAYAWFVIKKLMDRGYSLLLINGVGMLGGGLMSLITWYLARSSAVAPVVDWKQFLILVAALIILSNVVVYNLYGWLLNYYSVNAVSCAGFLSPIFGALYGKIFLGEQLGWQHFVAIGAIALGLYLFFQHEIHAYRFDREDPHTA
jgi:drug/metabolite transporter (DMT)-like permease